MSRQSSVLQRTPFKYSGCGGTDEWATQSEYLRRCLLQNVYYTSAQLLHIGLLSPTIDDDDNKCLVDVNSRPRLIECGYAAAKRMKLHWLFTQVRIVSWLPHRAAL